MLTQRPRFYHSETVHQVTNAVWSADCSYLTSLIRYENRASRGNGGGGGGGGQDGRDEKGRLAGSRKSVQGYVLKYSGPSDNQETLLGQVNKNVIK